jgi:hypothetical protein
VKITIAEPAVRARHQDGRDIIPAPAGDCPGAAGAIAAPSEPAEPGGTSDAATGTVIGTLTAPFTSLISAVLGESASSAATAPLGGMAARRAAQR